MKKSIILTFCFLLAVTVLVTAGCCKSVEEKATESIIESSTGGVADVDIDDNTMTINTNAGSVTVGEATTLPAGFPSDIHVIDGSITSVMTISENESYSVSIETSKTVAQAKTEYETELVKDGWTISLTLDTGEVSTVGAEKGNRSVTVSAMSDEGKTIVSIATTSREE